MSKKGSTTKAVKEKPKPAAVLVKELTAENEKLNQDLNMARNELAEVKSKLEHTNKQVLSTLDMKTLKDNFNIYESTDPLAIPHQTIAEILREVAIRRKNYETSIEAQLETVEKQLTKLSIDFARMSKKTLAYEQIMNELEQCQSMDQIKDKVQHMKLIAGKSTLYFQNFGL